MKDFVEKPPSASYFCELYDYYNRTDPFCFIRDVKKAFFFFSKTPPARGHIDKIRIHNDCYYRNFWLAKSTKEPAQL